MTDTAGHPDDETDARPDPDQTLPEGAGGADQPGASDRNSTTGSTPNEEYVGRVSGDDGGGYAGETGAERRQQVAREG